MFVLNRNEIRIALIQHQAVFERHIVETLGGMTGMNREANRVGLARNDGFEIPARIQFPGKGH